MATSQASINPRSLKRPRQDPVSCRFCRTKKLKCDRQNPCSNCAARTLPCEIPGPVAGFRSEQPKPECPGENASILARLQRLEDIVIGNLRDARSSSDASPVMIPSPISVLRQEKISNFAESRSSGSEYEEAAHKADVAQLEETGTRDAPWITLFSEHFNCQISPGHQILASGEAASLLLSGGMGFHPQMKNLFLPTHAEASGLLDVYAENVDDVQHVVYVPQVRQSLDEAYQHMACGKPVANSTITLLLSIFASSSLLLPHIMSSESRVFSSAEAPQLALYWATIALEILLASLRVGSAAFEDIQATIIMGFLTFHLEGFSARSQSLFSSGIISARRLSLHKIDAKPSKYSGTQATNSDPIETEIKRRVWWHLAATDWLLSLSGGPQEGTYFVQPHHMQVNMPRNVNDSELSVESCPIDHPLSTPTNMSYSIQRIKLADLCRRVVDLMPLARADYPEINYQDVILLDAKFEDFFQNLPYFLKIDAASRQQSESVERQFPHLKVQRYALGMIAHTRRSKLHQPFHIRGSVEGPYTYSRAMALRSARTVIEIKRLADSEHNSILETNFKLTGIIYHVFMAAIVLVMDLCFNKVDSENDARRAEILETFRMLEDAKSQSPVASDFIDSLINVLRKHKVRWDETQHGGSRARPSHRVPGSIMADAAQQLDSAVVGGGGLGRQNVHNHHHQQQQQQQQQPPQGSEHVVQGSLTDFDDIWKDYVEYTPQLDMPEWDELFADLEAHFT